MTVNKLHTYLMVNLLYGGKLRRRRRREEKRGDGEEKKRRREEEEKRRGGKEKGVECTFEQFSGGDDVRDGVRDPPGQLREVVAGGGLAPAGLQDGLQERAVRQRGAAPRLQRAPLQLRALGAVSGSLHPNTTYHIEPTII